MMDRRFGAAALALAIVLPAGCATKGFVREEIQKSETKSTAELGRVETGLTQEKERVSAIGVQVTETRGIAEDGVRRADRATGMATEASTRAGDAAARADATDQRLSRLWKNRHARTPVDSVVVRFRTNRADLDDRAQTALLDVVRQLQESPTLVVDLEGYTDSTGDPTYNVQLSQKRVESVRRFLAEKGIEIHRLSSIGLGESKPIADNKTRTGRDQNRRVAIRLFGPVE
jgi:outer membrane protein OmpA-like peptidoglycan-associated protein